ncbi:MAG TPA: CerR family C-terminal domain-containing protein [Steroidobacteraceae bacterium]|jgi:AcrR family transcriptional regulator|nr:CerR family C-terminal domain-containing protein [Steroidobacteraceae bacterium]
MQQQNIAAAPPRRQRSPRRRARAARPARAARSERTRARLIDAAGQLFAEQGIDRATGQDICRRAGVHSAAIVYHFGGMDGLYRAVLAEARRRLITTEALAAAAAAEHEPRRKLEAFLGLIVRTLASPMSQSWATQLFSREFVAPSATYGRSHDRILAERARILGTIISALTGLPPQDPAVARACVSIMAPCAVLLVFNRRKLSRLMSGMELTVEAAPQITRHLVAFALGGLKTLSAAARGGER